MAKRRSKIGTKRAGKISCFMAAPQSGCLHMTDLLDDLPILEFETAEQLRVWLEDHHANSKGMWLRIYKKRSGVRSVGFEQVLDEGLCFGWSESARRKYDNHSYIQKFTPRKMIGTQSARNADRIKILIKQGKMTSSGLAALGLDQEQD